jgi:hypothetical protein
MKKTISILILFLFCSFTFAQNTKVIDSPSGTVISDAGGTDIPYSASILDIRSANKGVFLPRMSTSNRDAIGSPQAGLLLYNTSTNTFDYHNGTNWQQATLSNQWSVNGAKYYYNGGNVGIGVSDPLYKLDVSGFFHTTSTGFIDGSLSVGGNAITPTYKIQVNDGSLSTYSTIDNKFWALSYNSGGNYLHLNEDGNSRVYFANGGNVGIGVNPAYKLDVAGAIHTTNNLIADGNATVDGSMTVNNGKGVAYNLLSSTNMKIAHFVTPQPSPFVLPAHGSTTFTINLPAGFTNAPTVLVGSQYLTQGTAGELYRIILVIYDCTTSQCTAKAINTDNASVDYWVRWNLIAIGN